MILRSGAVPRAALAAFLVATTLAGTSCQRQATAVPPRRVVLVSIDTLVPTHLGCYGYDRPTSPRLDAVAKEGVVFERATSPAPWTLPGHASMLTGLYPSHHGLRDHDVTLPESVATLASVLASHGFATAAVVNSHNLSPLFGLERGFQQYEYVKEEVARREPSRGITDRAIEWLGQHRDDRFFLFLHTYDVHSDYKSLPEYERQFVRPYTGPADGTTAQMIRARTGMLSLDRADAEHLKDLYDAGIRQYDDELGRLLDALGDDPRTMLIVTSDHGEEFGEHGGFLHGRTQFEEVVRIPLIVRGAGAPAGLRVDTTVSLIDVMPTILAAVGVPPPGPLDGVDLAPTWRGNAAAIGERTLFHEADHNNAEPDVTRAVRHDHEKLHFDRLLGTTLLFDLATDPGEQRDVSRARPERVEAFRADLEAFAKKHAATGASSVTLTPEQLERLKSLGYVR
ncbi:MAG: sulfatase [Deltaproteobacteria bacterium]|nr:sulfatase [Deltaproteobacteria bacterium]